MAQTRLGKVHASYEALRTTALDWIRSKPIEDRFTDALTRLELSPLLLGLLGMLDYHEWISLHKTSHTIRSSLRVIEANARLNTLDPWSMNNWHTYTVAHRFIANMPLELPDQIRLTVDSSPLTMRLIINKKIEARYDQRNTLRYSVSFHIDSTEIIANPYCLDARAALDQMLRTDGRFEWLRERLGQVLKLIPKLDYTTDRTTMSLDGAEPVKLPDLTRIRNFHSHWTVNHRRAVFLIYHWIARLARVTNLFTGENNTRAEYGLEYLRNVLGGC